MLTEPRQRYNSLLVAVTSTTDFGITNASLLFVIFKDRFCKIKGPAYHRFLYSLMYTNYRNVQASHTFLGCFFTLLTY